MRSAHSIFLAFKCPANSKFFDCLPMCPRSCAKSLSRVPCIETTTCQAGCSCIEGYILDSNGHCIIEELCGCLDSASQTYHPVKSHIFSNIVSYNFPFPLRLETLGLKATAPRCAVALGWVHLPVLITPQHAVQMHTAKSVNQEDPVTAIKDTREMDLPVYS